MIEFAGKMPEILIESDALDDNNEHSCGERFFSLRLKELHIEQKRSNDGRYWQDITLNN
jgi:hypothetical protein